MRIVIPGGTGQIGRVLTRGLRDRGHEVRVIGRSVLDPELRWDGRSDGAWMQSIDGADAVINLAGRSVNCRYHWPNLNEMMASRIDSTLAVGRAIERASRPPSVWLQASTASIYAHTQQPQDEASGTLGGGEPDAPAYWSYSVHIARAWELALAQAHTPQTRKVALRTGFTMSPDADGIFDWLVWLTDLGFGGRFMSGEQYVSWIGEHDLVSAVAFLLEHELEGPVNLTAPEPVPNSEFMATLARARGARLRLPIARWMARIGAMALKTDVELMQKSRRVMPRRLLDAGFHFSQPSWAEAAPTLLAQHHTARR